MNLVTKLYIIVGAILALSVVVPIQLVALHRISGSRGTWLRAAAFVVLAGMQFLSFATLAARIIQIQAEGRLNENLLTWNIWVNIAGSVVFYVLMITGLEIDRRQYKKHFGI